MPITVNSMVQSQQIQKTLDQSSNAVKQQTEALASGKRINSASDDAAGLAIVERMSSQIAGFDKAAQNINDGVSMLQVADGGLDNVTDQLQRMRELATQAANGTLSDGDRDALNQEYSQLNSQIQDTLSQTKFNDNAVLKNDDPVRIQTGPDSGQSVDLNGVNIEQSFADAGLSDQSISTQAGASDALEAIDSALEQVSSARATIGAEQNRLFSALNSNESNAVNTAQARSRIEDTDMAKSITELVKERTKNEAGILLSSQANADRGSILKLLS